MKFICHTNATNEYLWLFCNHNTHGGWDTILIYETAIDTVVLLKGKLLAQQLARFLRVYGWDFVIKPLPSDVDIAENESSFSNVSSATGALAH